MIQLSRDREKHPIGGKLKYLIYGGLWGHHLHKKNRLLLEHQRGQGHFASGDFRTHYWRKAKDGSTHIVVKGGVLERKYTAASTPSGAVSTTTMLEPRIFTLPSGSDVPSGICEYAQVAAISQTAMTAKNLFGFFDFIIIPDSGRWDIPLVIPV